MVGEFIEIGGVKITPKDLKQVASFQVDFLHFYYSPQQGVWSTSHDGVSYLVNTNGQKVQATEI
jgi:hypothetical protein